MSGHLQGYWEVEMKKKNLLLASMHSVMGEVYVYNDEKKTVGWWKGVYSGEDSLLFRGGKLFLPLPEL